MRPALALAAAVAIAVGAFSFLQTPASIERVELASVGKVLGSVSVESTDGDSVPAAAGMTLVAGEHLMTGQDGGVALVLATGESVRLNAGTEILLAATGSLELRSGAIYLDSERVADGSSGVIVATRFGDVQHIGTQYQVNVDSRDLIVRIREGAVAIDLGAQDLVGRAGEQIVVPRAGDIVRTGISPTDAAWLWAESLATLPEAAEYALVELLSWYARQTGRELRFQSQAIEREAGELVLHGIGGLNPDEVLEVIRSTTSLGYQLSSDSLMVD
jgi:ferric-dicitrate binding protein FerR (iron transport regulator)